MSENTAALIAFTVFYTAIYWSCYYFECWLRGRIIDRRKVRPIRIALKRQRESLMRLDRSVRMLEEAIKEMRAECVRMESCGVLFKGCDDDKLAGEVERCEVCGGEFRVDENGELRCFDCNPPQDDPQFAVGDRVRFVIGGEESTITDMGVSYGVEYIELQDDNGNFSTCHVCDIEKADE